MLFTQKIKLLPFSPKVLYFTALDLEAILFSDTGKGLSWVESNIIQNYSYNMILVADSLEINTD